VTTNVARAIVVVVVDFAQMYLAVVGRISGYPMTKAARTRILAEVEAIYRRERAATEAATSAPATNARVRVRRDRSRSP
jgi:hypothetical protein